METLIRKPSVKIKKLLDSKGFDWSSGRVVVHYMPDIWPKGKPEAWVMADDRGLYSVSADKEYVTFIPNTSSPN